MTAPLDQLRVLSLAEQYPGPYATAMLADLGADVVQVERPAGGDPTRAFPAFHESLARGKRSVALDLKAPAGRDAFLALVSTADVLLEGYRPGTMARLGLDQPTLAAAHPGLVYVSISGFGQDGPYRDLPGHDLTYQALAGTLYDQLTAGDPPRPTALELGDLTAGLLAVQAVLLGLVQRQRTGRGPHVDVSMFDGLVALLAAHLVPQLNHRASPGFPHEPGYAVFRTADGLALALGVAHEDHFWRALCGVLGLDQEAALTSAQRMSDHARLRGLIGERIATGSCADWAARLTAAGVPHGAVRDLDALPDDPHVAARRLLSTVTAPDGTPRRFLRQPLTVDGVAWGARAGAPRLGQHTAGALREAGLAEADIDALLASGAAVQAPQPERTAS